MIKTQEIADPTSCLNQAEDDEILFVLKANDPIAPFVVEFWAYMSQVRNIHLQRIDEAKDCAMAMRIWKLAHPDG